MLTLYTGRGVTPEVNLREYISHTALQSSNKAEPTLALKPRGDITRSPKQGCQWPHKWTCDSPFWWRDLKICEMGKTKQELPSYLKKNCVVELIIFVTALKVHLLLLLFIETSVRYLHIYFNTPVYTRESHWEHFFFTAPFWNFTRSYQWVNAASLKEILFVLSLGTEIASKASHRHFYLLLNLVFHSIEMTDCAKILIWNF